MVKEYLGRYGWVEQGLFVQLSWASHSPGTGRVLFAESCITCFRGRGWRERGPYDLSASAFLNRFFTLSYSICQGAIFWVSMSWTWQKQRFCHLIFLFTIMPKKWTHSEVQNSQFLCSVFLLLFWFWFVKPSPIKLYWSSSKSITATRLSLMKLKKKKTWKTRRHRQEVFQMSFSFLVCISSNETAAKQFRV